MAQPTSGTVNFNPSLADYIIEAYARLQIRGPSLTAEHMHEAVMSANFLQSEWTTNDGPNLWKVTLRSIPLIQGQSTYSLATDVVDILDYYLRLPDSGSAQDTADIVVTPISRTEYADQPEKNRQSRPTVVWWDRLVQSSVTVWPVPDANGPYTLFYYCETQMQDASLPQGATIDVVYRFFDAFAAGLAAKLAEKYSPPEVQVAKKQMADAAWDKAATKDIERVPLYIVPGLGFYRN